MDDYLQIISHDAFRYGGGLNKSAGEVYWWLLQTPMTVKEIMAKTGRGRATIFRVLRRMQKLADRLTGECLPMVQNNGGTWQACEGVDLYRVAHVVGTAGTGNRKHAQYKREQVMHRKSLELGKNI